MHEISQVSPSFDLYQHKSSAIAAALGVDEKCGYGSSPCGWHGTGSTGKRKAFHRCECACGAGAATPSGTCDHRHSTVPPCPVSAEEPEAAVAHSAAFRSWQSARGKAQRKYPKTDYQPPTSIKEQKLRILEHTTN